MKFYQSRHTEQQQGQGDGKGRFSARAVTAIAFSGVRLVVEISFLALLPI